MLTEANALALVRSEINEATPAFWTDDEITKWIKEGCTDISLRSLCIEKIVDVSIISDTIRYTQDSTTTDFSKLIKVDSAMINDKALVKQDMKAMSKLAHLTPQVPKYYFHYAESIIVFPKPDASYTLELYGIYLTDDITEIPDTYSYYPVWYAVSKCLLKDRKNSEAAQYYNQYISSTIQSLDTTYTDIPDSKRDTMIRR